MRNGLEGEFPSGLPEISGSRSSQKHGPVTPINLVAGYFQGNHRETELDIDYFLGRDSLVPA